MYLFGNTFVFPYDCSFLMVLWFSLCLNCCGCIRTGKAAPRSVRCRVDGFCGADIKSPTASTGMNDVDIDTVYTCYSIGSFTVGIHMILIYTPCHGIHMPYFCLALCFIVPSCPWLSNDLSLLISPYLLYVHRWIPANSLARLQASTRYGGISYFHCSGSVFCIE